MTTRSHRLWGPTKIDSTSPMLLYTAPPARTVLVKAVRVVSNTDDPCAFEYGIGGVGSDFAVMPWTPCLGRRIVTDDGWFVLQENDELWCRAETADALTITGSGAILLAGAV